jgi:hypothetical protein
MRLFDAGARNAEVASSSLAPSPSFLSRFVNLSETPACAEARVLTLCSMAGEEGGSGRASRTMRAYEAGFHAPNRCSRFFFWFFAHFARGLGHCDFIPEVVHVPGWVQNLGTIAPELAPWWTDASGWNSYPVTNRTADGGRRRSRRGSGLQPRRQESLHTAALQVVITAVEHLSDLKNLVKISGHGILNEVVGSPLCADSSLSFFSVSGVRCPSIRSVVARGGGRLNGGEQGCDEAAGPVIRLSIWCDGCEAEGGCVVYHCRSRELSREIRGNSRRVQAKI